MKSANETQTSSDESNKKSQFEKFCLERGINSNLLMLKMTLFVMHGGNAVFILIKLETFRV